MQKYIFFRTLKKKLKLLIIFIILRIFAPFKGDAENLIE